MANREKHMTPTRSGTLAHIRIRGVLHRRHFPNGTAIVKVKQWLLKTELKYRGNPLAVPGTFEHDAARYLEIVKAMPTYAQRAQHVQEWITAFGTTPRDEITAAMIQQQLTIWRSTERQVKQRTKKGADQRYRTLILSAAAVNKRRTALMHLFTVLDGKAGQNPVRDVPKFSTPTEQPRGLDYATIRKIFTAMPASKSKARLMVMAYTGIPPAQMKRISPEDADLTGMTVSLVGRRKGRGTQGRLIPLTTAGVKAFQMMAREGAFGPFANSTLRVTFSRACRTALGRDGLTPYDLRHSFGTEVYRSSGDIRATQVLMGHSTPQLTHRYTLNAVEQRLTDALRQFGKRRRR